MENTITIAAAFTYASDWVGEGWGFDRLRVSTLKRISPCLSFITAASLMPSLDYDIITRIYLISLTFN